MNPPQTQIESREIFYAVTVLMSQDHPARNPQLMFTDSSQDVGEKSCILQS